MAKHLTDQEVTDLKAKPYLEIRKKLRSGDLMFASGEYLVSKAIRRFTNSPWSHVGILFYLKNIDRVLLLESVEDMGVRFAPLSKYSEYENKKAYKGIIVLARCKGIDKNAVQELAKFGIDELTRPYDTDEIGKIVARIALGMGKKEHDREYICSELVYECFAKAGKEFAYDNRGFISPENIWCHPKLEILGRIYWEKKQ
jgi:uncharacterized protein YycO